MTIVVRVWHDSAGQDDPVHHRWDIRQARFTMSGKLLVVTILLALAGVAAYEYVLLQGLAPA